MNPCLHFAFLEQCNTIWSLNATPPSLLTTLPLSQVATSLPSHLSDSTTSLFFHLSHIATSLHSHTFPTFPSHYSPTFPSSPPSH